MAGMKYTDWCCHLTIMDNVVSSSKVHVTSAIYTLTSHPVHVGIPTVTATTTFETQYIYYLLFILYYIILYYIILYYIILYYITLRYVTSRHVTSRHVTLRYVTLHYITLHYITLHYITLHYITLHYITLQPPPWPSGYDPPAGAL